MRSPKAIVEDVDLQDAVQCELEWDARVDADRVHVSARDGAVALTGSVPTLAQKAAAVQAAERVYGVKAVADDLDVSLMAGTEKRDAHIAQAIAHERDWNSWIPDSVEAEVSNGHVTLRGLVEWSYQRDEALHAVSRLEGVRGVVDEIAVRPEPRTEGEDVALRIEEALTRMADLDARSIRVTTTNGTVRLHGTVKSVADRRLAQRAAESAPGVTDVENDLVVEP